MKSIWNGSLSFSLVSIPLRLYAATQEHILGFKMLCDTCHTPIQTKRWCAHCKKEVSWEHIVKGLEVSKGNFVVLTQEEIKSLKPKTSEALTIRYFIDQDIIDPVSYNEHYYGAPAKSERAFTVFHHALMASKKVAVGQFVMHEKEHVCIIRPYHNALLVTTLLYAYEIRDLKEISILKEKQPAITSQELKVAQQIVFQMTSTTFDLSEFKDTFAQELKKALKQKKAGKKNAPSEKKSKKRPEKSLLHTLQESLKEQTPKRAR